ncbi:putative disease resistance protein RGA3 [Coffea eugenioides]|uniref:putative disease resistance protein RGA3 n=1 Tax=Coffea eugenioides TaxID=49369 RepID=UPI000F612948|nr:putative disease resistance protein RGA3 [Coffea eugenioides]
MAQRCRGLPLAASVLGGMLRNKGADEWQTLELGLRSLGRDENVDIAKIMKLSFDHLPNPSLKKCFAYCSIFPKDFQMERNRLIQLWAAEGFLHSNPGNNMCMEDVGNMHFTILLDSNLFQDAENDGYGNVLNCKMHDLVHDISISKFKTTSLKESNHDQTFPIRYLAMERSGGEARPFPLNENFKYITTLFLLENISTNDRLISFLACLRVLNLVSSDAKELPKSIEVGRQIGQLRSLKNLSGSFEIRNLELVRNKEEAKFANLIRKPNIDELRLLWNELDNPRENDSEYNQVLECLQPHRNLKGLIIERFFGDQLWTWIGKLEKLVKYELLNCKNCKELPTLGHMPFLRSLHLEGLDGITSIGPSFYSGSAVHGDSSNQRPLKLFPALEHLILKNMSSLSEWTKAVVHDRKMVVFPILETMEIDNCPQLDIVPNHFPRLKKLDFMRIGHGSTVLSYMCNRVSTLISLLIENVNELTELPDVLFETIQILQILCCAVVVI